MQLPLSAMRNAALSSYLLSQIGLHSTDDSKSDEELVWRATEWKTIPYREYPWTLSAMQARPPTTPPPASSLPPCAVPLPFPCDPLATPLSPPCYPFATLLPLLATPCFHLASLWLLA